MIRLASLEDLEITQSIVHETISSVYPNYYPQEVVEFFLEHHKKESIKEDIQSGKVYLLFDGDGFVATGTIDGEYMNRVFVLPVYHGKGYGSAIMDFLEEKIRREHTRVCVDSSLPAFGIYLKRGYVPVEYQEKVVENGRVLCYQIMTKESVTQGLADFNLNNRLFTSVSNSDNGEVSGETLFNYYQENKILWAHYSGGDIEKGYLVGKFTDADRIYFTYQHINTEGDIRIGECRSKLVRLGDDRIRMYESWKWLNGDMAAGESVVEEKNIR
ncbi:GNAT family N-acetyltransferase [Dysgonomonas macrotermitis]|uniref:Ribosomal protein S18 acetylase RimI n=1 Tax=Dysgonomonas macrotermitis TaxID=1346286 RepID=A0A1M5D5Z3_9BACT|nr:GNAT family N-acetyltransferase [Dysgonomonas macrotermitis]SHF62406.1 Ribosomal protein S18 acetylase RimI [Dysgonomonas macrotermitis]